MKKIIFLDIDGVLNSLNFFKTRYIQEKNDMFQSDFNSIDDKALECLSSIVKQTEAEIVISSTWRFNHYETLLRIFEMKNFVGKIIGKTGRGGCVRGCQIHEWLRDNKDYIGIDSASKFKNYVIIDDDSDMLLWQKDNFVHTNNEFGLLPEHIDLAVKILNQ